MIIKLVFPLDNKVHVGSIMEDRYLIPPIVGDYLEVSTEDDLLDDKAFECGEVMYLVAKRILHPYWVEIELERVGSI